jgi:hypothetical protein
MRHYVAFILVCLVGGVIVNIGTALACSVVAQWQSGVVRKPAPDEHSSLNQVLPAPYFVHGLPGDGTLVAFGYQELTTLAYAYAAKGAPAPPLPRYLHVSHIEAGWPLKSLRRTDTQPARDGDVDAAIANSMAAYPSVRSRAENRIIMPTQPVWRGFAINSLLFAAAIWIVPLPWRVHRLCRRRRGLCEACGYPIGSNPTCTECGRSIIARPGSHR